MKQRWIIRETTSRGSVRQAIVAAAAISQRRSVGIRDNRVERGRRGWTLRNADKSEMLIIMDVDKRPVSTAPGTITLARHPSCGGGK